MKREEAIVALVLALALVAAVVVLASEVLCSL